MVVPQTWQSMAFRTLASTAVTVGIVEYLTEFPSKGRSSWLYHCLADDYITPGVRLLLAPERAHNFAIQMASRGLFPIHRRNSLEDMVNLRQTLFRKNNQGVPSKDQEKDEGLLFENPIGLAAGFDKDGTIVQGMLDLGFGFVEIGTVTPKPQPGNPSPRLFRLIQDKALINRYGFNSGGAQQVHSNLTQFRAAPQQQQQQHKDNFNTTAQTNDNYLSWIRSVCEVVWFTFYPKSLAVGPIGINIGKNRDTESDSLVIADYVSNIKQFASLADYLVINVSSPNTPGLGDHWQKPTQLKTLLRACLEARNHLGSKVPILVKLSPDLNDVQLAEIAELCLELGIDGIIASNTTQDRAQHLLDSHRSEVGGLSGLPLQQRSTEMIRALFQHTQGKIPIIGVGGVFHGRDVLEKLHAGASLVQVYTALIYQGPGTVSRIRQELADILIQNGEKSLDDVIGKDHEEWFFANKLQKKKFEQHQEKIKIED